MEPAGAGSLQLAFEQLKQRLKAEGLFEAERKRPLPAFPRTVGIITSPTGAVIRDFLNIAGRRHSGLDVLLYPVSVQGESAPAEIEEALAALNAQGRVDVIVLARGGGSLEDLSAFNSERVARAMASSRLPVVSAVGHETDFTIADFVADLRAPTPSAAAEIVICTRQSLEDRVHASELKLTQSMRLNLALMHRRWQALAVDQTTLHRAIGKQMQRVDEMDYRLRDRWRGLVESRRRALESISSRLAQCDVRLQFARARRRLDASEAAVAQAVKGHLSRAQRALGPLEAHLSQLSPVKILERGYAIVELDGRIVKSPEEAPAGSDVSVRLAEGRLKARVL
jgi:exodeoxyribonuclease VII large subunit